jgi:hypothetical protein
MYFVKPAFEEFCSPVSILVSCFISNTQHPQITLLLAARHLNFTHSLAGLLKGIRQKCRQYKFISLRQCK